METSREVVITGMGVVSPIGVGVEAFWSSMMGGKSGVRTLSLLEEFGLEVNFGAAVEDYEPKQYVKPRKSMKVMCREIQMAFGAASMAAQQAGLEAGTVPNDRIGVVFGSEMHYCDIFELQDAIRGCVVDGEFCFDRWGERVAKDLYPLWMLKYLPNMAACHIGIALDARAHNNTIVLGEVSSLLALIECVRVIQRGAADVMVTGGISSRIHIMPIMDRSTDVLSKRKDDPAAASRPFDADRDGMVDGEGTAALVLETRESAEARGAEILASIRGFGTGFEPPATSGLRSGSGIRRSITEALSAAGLTPADIGHVNAHGISTVNEDIVEAKAIQETLGDVPVTASKSYFGNLGPSSGAVELVAAVQSLVTDTVPPTLNYNTPDPNCPINVVAGSPLNGAKPTALALNQATTGQAVAVAISR